LISVCISSTIKRTYRIVSEHLRDEKGVVLGEAAIIKDKEELHTTL